LRFQVVDATFQKPPRFLGCKMGSLTTTRLLPINTPTAAPSILSHLTPVVFWPGVVFSSQHDLTLVYDSDRDFCNTTAVFCVTASVPRPSTTLTLSNPWLVPIRPAVSCAPPLVDKLSGLPSRQPVSGGALPLRGVQRCRLVRRFLRVRERLDDAFVRLPFPIT